MKFKFTEQKRINALKIFWSVDLSAQKNLSDLGHQAHTQLRSKK